MKPFLFLATRTDDLVADGEYEAMLRFSGLDEAHLRRVRMEQGPIGPIDLDDYAGTILGGGPFNASDTVKSAVQQRVEGEISDLLDEIVPRDLPFLGACYGIGTLGTLAGGVVDRTYAEPIGPMGIDLSDEGRRDPLLVDLPARFTAFLGHKEAVSRLPDGAVLLASSATCPVQAFRLGSRVYATQFHPELDVDGLVTRIGVYEHFGYFEPHEADELLARARSAIVTEPPRILRRFVELFARD